MLLASKVTLHVDLPLAGRRKIHGTGLRVAGPSAVVAHQGAILELQQRAAATATAAGPLRGGHHPGYPPLGAGAEGLWK